MTVASRFYFDSRFWLPLLLRSSTRTTSAFDSSSGKISGFGLQSALRAATPTSALDAPPGFDSELTLASGFDASFGGCYQHRLVGAASAARAGAGTGRGRVPEPGADGKHRSAVNESSHTLVYCSYSNVDFRKQWALQLGIGLDYYIIIIFYNSNILSFIT